jgi:hypothetical protein
MDLLWLSKDRNVLWILADSTDNFTLPWLFFPHSSGYQTQDLAHAKQALYHWAASSPHLPDFNISLLACKKRSQDPSGIQVACSLSGLCTPSPLIFTSWYVCTFKTHLLNELHVMRCKLKAPYFLCSSSLWIYPVPVLWMEAKQHHEFSTDLQP